MISTSFSSGNQSEAPVSTAMINPSRKQAIRLFAAGCFSLAGLVWLAATLASSSDRPLHIATTVLFATSAAIWLVSYLVGRSKA